jgi:N,N'-diacetylchitobiose transport system permease protein
MVVNISRPGADRRRRPRPGEDGTSGADGAADVTGPAAASGGGTWRDRTGRLGRTSSGRPPGGRSARRGRQLLPYLLVAPAAAVLATVLGYPLLRLLVMSFQEYGLAQQFGRPAPFVGLANYQRIFADPQFWTVLVRTVVFCAVNVGATMVFGVLVALIMQALGGVMRGVVGVGLLLAWAIPPLAATVIWQWLFDTQYGLVNWLITATGLADFRGHSWLSDPLSFFAVATVVVVWMGVPFVALTTYAGLTTVPTEVIEAAELDGASTVQRIRHVVLPFVAPVLSILAALSTLWDFRVFTQIYVLQKAGGVARDTNVLGIYAYRISIGENRFDVGAAVAVVMVALAMALTAVYVRQMLRQQEEGL